MAWALLVVTAAAASITVVGWLGLTGRLRRNRWAGIRTRFTLSNDERWDETHRAAAPWFIFGGVAATAAGLAFLPFALAGKVPDAVAVTVTLTVALLVFASGLAGWLRGERSARIGTGQGEHGDNPA